MCLRGGWSILLCGTPPTGNGGPDDAGEPACAHEGGNPGLAADPQAHGDAKGTQAKEQSEKLTHPHGRFQFSASKAGGIGPI